MIKLLEKIYSPLLRIGSVGLGFLYLAYITSASTVAADYFVVLAIGQILGNLVPFGSNNHLVALKNPNLGWLSYASACLAVLALTLISQSDFYGALIFVGCIVLFERVSLASAIRNKKIATHFSRLFFGRLIAIGIAYTFRSSLLDTLGGLMTLEFFARAPLFRMSENVDRPEFEVKNTLLAALSTVATWWPIANGGRNATANDLFVSRVILLLLGFSSVFYLTNEALSFHRNNKVSLGWVRESSQIIIICISLASIIIFFLTKGALPPKLLTGPLMEINLYQALALIICVTLWFFAWNGAITVVNHSLRSEMSLSLLTVFAALVLSFSSFPVYLQVLLVGVSWHIGVIFFYKEG